MNETLSQLSERYRQTLQDFLQGAGESALTRAYELGREAVNENLGLLELGAIHRTALADALRVPVDTNQAIAVAKAATSFFLESLAPFEIPHQSYREASQALRASQEKYRDLIENARDIIFTLDLDGNFTSVNRAGEKISGYRRNELPPVNIAQILAPENWDLAKKILDQKYIADGSITSEAEILARDGRRLTVEVSAQLIHQDGQAVGIQGIARDVTQRKRAEQKFQSLLEAAPDAMVVVNEEGKIVLVNAQVELAFGYPREELLGKPVELLVPMRHRRRHARHRADYLGSPRKRPMGQELDLFGVRKDGTQFPVEISLSPLETEEGLLITSAIRDITDRKRAEEALQHLNQALEQEASRIAHALHDEAGQLLATVHIAVDEAAQNVPPSARKRLLGVKPLLDEIEEHLRRLSHELRPTILDDLGLIPALDFLVDGFRGRTRIAVATKFEIADRLPPQTETAIYRVVQEALTNIARHAKASEVDIQIERRDGVIRGAIRDNGIGSDQASFSDHRGKPGLGLMSMRARLDAVGGRLLVHSRKGEGTVIEFTILREESDAYPNTLG